MNVLALGAHPDDIEYGCGGMLTKYAEKGHDVFLWIASDGSLGGEGAVRRQEQTDSALIIGAREVFWGDYPRHRGPAHPGAHRAHRDASSSRSSRG